MTPVNNRRRTFVAAAIVLGCGLAAATAIAWSADTVKGNGVIRKQDRTPGHFTALELSLPAQVEVRLDTTDSVSIEADENLLPMMETAIENGALQLRPVRRNLQLESRNIRIVVNAKEINALGVAGSGGIMAAVLRAPKLSLEIGGSGRIDVAQVQADAVDAQVAGSGNMKLAGAAKKLSISVAGSGDLTAPKLKADDVEVSIAGSGNAVVWAVGALTTSIAGSGDVRYYGDPKTTTSVAGSGRLNRVGPTP